jgi:FHS family L-fucose permease-like MFS transporter
MPERPSSLLWVIFLAYFTFGMITNVLGVIIPEVINQYQLSLFAAGFLAFSFFLAYGICSIPTGLMMDRFGAKPLLLFGVTLMTLGCLVVAWAQTYPVMLAMIFTVGVGVTIVQTAGNPLIQHLDRVENYHRNLTLTIGFCGIGAFGGPFILAFIRGTGRNWQSLYTFFALLCFVLLLLLAMSSFASARAATTSKFRVDQLGKLLRNPLLLAYALGIFCYVGAEVGTASWIVKFFENVHGLSGEVAHLQSASLIEKVLPTLPALVVALFWGLQGSGRLVSGAILNRFGSRRILRIYSFMALALLLAADFGTKNISAVAFAACGFFTSVLFTLIFSGTINSFSENHGTISGLLCTAILGGALIPPLVGWVGDHFDMRMAMLVPAVCFTYVFGLAMFGRAKYE